MATTSSSAGYPKEEILLVHEPKVFARLTELSRKELTKVAKRVPLVFDDLKVRRAGSGTHVVVPRDDFERHFHAFTSGIFADWEPSLWSNVLVAGAHRLPHLLFSLRPSTFGTVPFCRGPNVEGRMWSIRGPTFGAPSSSQPTTADAASPSCLTP